MIKEDKLIAISVLLLGLAVISLGLRLIVYMNSTEVRLQKLEKYETRNH